MASSISVYVMLSFLELGGVWALGWAFSITVFVLLELN